MDCSAFRKKHTSYIDEVLSGEEAEAMEAHIRSCQLCAARDAQLRRALFLVRNIPQIEPTADFKSKLLERIGRERSREKPERLFAAGPSVRAFSAIAATLIFIGALTVGMGALTVGVSEGQGGGENDIPRLPGVVALPPAALDSATAPAIVAAMSAGMAVWPALWLAEEAPFQYASYASRPNGGTSTQP